MLACAALGYKSVAVDLRGYGPSSKPTAVESYAQDAVVADVVAVSQHVSPDRKISCLVGHDWGAFVAWACAVMCPDSFDRLAILNVPHPVPFGQGMQTLTQLRKSWYMFAFQFPVLPEAVLQGAHFALLRQMLRTDPDTPMSAADIERHILQFSANPGAMSAALNYYRAMFRGYWGEFGGPVGALQGFLRRASGAQMEPPAHGPQTNVIEMPVQIIWGMRDRYLGKEMAEPPMHLVPNQQPTAFLDATHWVHWDRSEEVNRILANFIASHRN